MSNWTNVADFYFDNLSYQFFIQKIIEYAEKIQVTVYEDGLLIENDENCKLILIKEKTDSEGHSKYRIMSSTQIVPSSYMKSISNTLSLMMQIYDVQPEITKKGVSTRVEKKKPFSIDALVYSDTELDDYEKIDDNVYRIKSEGTLEEGIPFTNDKILKCDNKEKAYEASQKMLVGKGKVLVND